VESQGGKGEGGGAAAWQVRHVHMMAGGLDESRVGRCGVARGEPGGVRGASVWRMRRRVLCPCSGLWER